MTFNFALAGNPNSGKTTLFNKLTGSNAHVGNWPGVTVEKREGKIKDIKEDITIVDLPGIYSLSPYTSEELVARDYLANGKVDLIINIVDATSIERNLYLTTQILELKIPTIIALNMMDEVRAQKAKIDIEKIAERIGVPIIPISASKGRGIGELIKESINFIKNPKLPEKTALEYSEISETIHSVQDVLKNANKERTLYHAVKLLEKDKKIKSELKLDHKVQLEIDKIEHDEEIKTGQELEVLIADLRYKYITDITTKYIKNAKSDSQLSISDKIDKIVTNRIIGIPLFFIIMYIVFQISVGSIGKALAEPFSYLVVNIIPNAIASFLANVHASGLVTSLVLDGIVNGIAALLGFLPLIVMLFLCLSILEDIGYMARVAFVMDKIFRYFGMSGKAFVPLIMGYGCSVPGIMATRTLEDEKSRKIAITIMPFMSCSAKIPVYAIFAGVFFSQNQALVTFSIYMLGIAVAMISSILLNKTAYKGEAPPFVLELPVYRIPSLKSVLIHTWEKAKGYLIKVGTVLFTMSVVIWVLQTFNFSFGIVQDPAQSMLGQIGAFISPIFTLNGFGISQDTGLTNWQVGAALLTGLIAKEAIISSFGILYGLSGTVGSLAGVLQLHFTPLSAYALMAFILLYAPCVAAIATTKKELGSWKGTLFTIAYQCVTAWVVSMIIFQVGSLLGIGL